MTIVDFGSTRECPYIITHIGVRKAISQSQDGQGIAGTESLGKPQKKSFTNCQVIQALTPPPVHDKTTRTPVLAPKF